MTLLARRATVAPTVRGLTRHYLNMDLSGHWAKRAACDENAIKGTVDSEELRELKPDPDTKGEQAEKADGGSE